MAIPIQKANAQTDIIRVVAESPPVYRLSMGVLLQVNEFGTNLANGDEVITGPGGKAHILLSLLSDQDEISIAPSSRMMLTKDTTDPQSSIYKLRLQYGKVRAKTMLSRNKQVRIDTDSVEVIADEGEFIVESNAFGTSVGTISGIVKMESNETNQGRYVPQKTMTSVQKSSSIPPVSGFSKNLFKGVEKSEKERTIDPVALQEEHKKQAEIEKARRLIAEQKERERQKALALAKQKEQEEAERQRQLALLQAQVDEMNKKMENPQQVDEILEPAMEPVLQESPEGEEEGFFTKYKWHIVASSTFLVSYYLATSEASKYNDLASENDSLSTQYANSSSASERESIIGSFESNKAKMDQHKSNMDLFNYMTIAAFVWEGYLIYDLMFSGEEESTGEASALNHTNNSSIRLLPTYSEGKKAVQLSFNWNW